MSPQTFVMLGTLAQWVAVVVLFIFVRHWGKFALRQEVREERQLLTAQLLKEIHETQRDMLHDHDRAAAALAQAVIDLQRLKESA